MSRDRPGGRKVPPRLRTAANLRAANADYARRIRAGEVSDEEIDRIEGPHRELAYGGESLDVFDTSDQARSIAMLLRAGRESAAMVVEAIEDYRSARDSRDRESDEG